MHLGEYYLALEAFKKAMEKAGVSVEKATDPDGTRKSSSFTLFVICLLWESERSRQG